MACEGEEAMELTCVSVASEREAEARGSHNKPLEFCYFYTHSKGDFLQSCIRERIVYKYKPSAIFFSPEPLSAVLAWPRAQLALALLSATWLVFITLKLQSIQSAGYFSLVNEEARVREFSTAAFGRDRELACSWELVLEMFISFLLGVSGLLISILAHTSRIELAKLLMLVTGFVGITTNFIIFVKLTLQGSARSGLRTPSWFFLVNVMTDVLLFPMPLAVNESWVVELVLLDSIVHLSVEFADGQLPYLYMLMATVALSFLLARERMRRRVLREMRQEQEGAWEEEWMKMRGSWALRSLTKALRVGPDYRSFAFGSFGPIVIDEEAELDYIPACNPKTNTKSVKQILRFRHGWKMSMQLYDYRWFLDWLHPAGVEDTSQILNDISSTLLACKANEEKPEITVATFKSLYAGDLLDTQLEKTAHGVLGVSTSTIMFSSTPLTSAMHKRFFQLVTLVVGISFGYFVFTGENAAQVSRNGMMQSDAYRLRIKTVRNASAAARPEVYNSSFALVRDCCSRFYPSSVSVRDSFLYFSFNESFPANGWQLEIASDRSLAQFDPHELTLQRWDETSDAGNASWEEISSFSCRAHPELKLCNAVGELASDTTIRFELREPWRKIMRYVNHVEQSAVCFLAVFFALIRNSFLAKTFVSSPFHIAGVLELVTCMPVNFLDPESAHDFIFGIADLGYGLILQFKERYTLSALPVYCLVTTLGDIAIGMDWFQSPQPFHVDYIPFSTYVLLVAWSYFWFSRKMLLRKALKAIEGDKIKYDEQWKLLVSQQESLERLTELASKCKQVPSSPAKQKGTQDVLFDPDNPSIYDRLLLQLHPNDQQPGMSGARTIKREHRISNQRVLFRVPEIVMAAGWGSAIAAVAMVAMVGGMVAVLTSPSPLAATSQLLSTSEQESSRKLVGGDRRTVGWVKVDPPKIHISPLHVDASIDDGSLDSLYRESENELLSDLREKLQEKVEKEVQRQVKERVPAMQAQLEKEARKKQLVSDITSEMEQVNAGFNAIEDLKVGVEAHKALFLICQQAKQAESAKALEGLEEDMNSDETKTLFQQAMALLNAGNATNCSSGADANCTNGTSSELQEEVTSQEKAILKTNLALKQHQMALHKLVMESKSLAKRRSALVPKSPLLQVEKDLKAKKLKSKQLANAWMKDKREIQQETMRLNALLRNKESKSAKKVTPESFGEKQAFMKSFAKGFGFVSKQRKLTQQEQRLKQIMQDCVEGKADCLKYALKMKK
ncbi:hypothetical protein GUITHDRAFT_134859 [Guillardia theta CCMP2712]|uniref:Uncharacterized protein n=1 Tax=Guillardia theta (strain CCMP2712) TaxID=905079 RepID=L1JQJ4_GUITC|nr:hypothetical protein GUITHDRAFT_134859 [Guillardia theta CCMP2712]EKX50727.1 hypothetical protein GUITHDRAFT_134859 [Guillardia theta CCMP2712]|eukprot:XP_005837707.1 hypothetical protein GUITHDRAFT_134859 [Guillardia theta CCMP2712]